MVAGSLDKLSDTFFIDFGFPELSGRVCDFIEDENNDGNYILTYNKWVKKTYFEKDMTSAKGILSNDLLLKRAVPYFNGKKHGVAKFYKIDSGNTVRLCKEVTFKQGVMHGNVIEYYSNLEVKQITPYRYNKKHRHSVRVFYI